MSELVGEGRTAGTDDRPLTDVEFKQLQRLLSDPFSLPIQFKTWLVSYLESSDLSLPMSAIIGLTSMLGITGVGSGTLGILPAGLIFPYGGGSAPAGAKMCDGASYSQAAENRLWLAIGNSYNPVGAPPGTFNVPDLQARFPIGKGTHTEVDTLGKSDGQPVAQRRASHQHHAGREVVSLTPGSTAYNIIGSGATRDVSTDDTASQMVNKEPFLVVNFIIIA